jgi:hypothetical protein
MQLLEHPRTDLLTRLAALYNKESHELALRVLSDATQTRTRNLMIDVIGQSGHYPPNATTLNGFVVKASSIAGCTRLCQGFGEAGVTIDRFTGQVIDKQIEVVNE